MVFQVRAVVFCALFFAAVASQWPVAPRSAPETLPNIELSLEPPLHPWPQVAAELGKLEETRERIENANMDKLTLEFNKAGVEARHRIGDVVGRAMRVFDDPALAQKIFVKRNTPKLATTFRQTPQEALGSSVLSVKVNVVPASPPDASLRARVDDIEYQRSDKERENVFESAFAEVRALTDFIVNELEVQIQRNVNTIVGSRALAFLQQPLEAKGGALASPLPSQSNVRVVPTEEGYPTVASMVQEMEVRRDMAETLERKRVLEKCIDFVMACNSAAEGALKTAISRILAQYAGVAKSLRNRAPA